MGEEERAPNRQASVDSRRIALEREIHLRFPAFDTFITEYSCNHSTTGMFIASERPQPPGSTFSFEFSVADDWKLIRGKAQVVWARYKAEGPSRPAGMGARFAELDPQSRRLIRWIVEKHIREGGKPFELDELRSALDEVIGDALQEPADEVRETAPAASFPAHVKEARSTRASAPPAPRPRRRRIPAAWLTAIGVTLAVALLIWLSEVGPRLGAGSATADSPRPDTTAGASPASAAGNPASDPQAAAESADLAPPAASAETSPQPASDLRRSAAGAATTVAAWAEAWSDQAVDEYLAFYASSFDPPDELTVAAWQSQRSDRLTRPEFIEVTLSDLETELDGDDRAIARFRQRYRSDTYQDEVSKLLEMVWQDGAWKIEVERVTG